MLFDARTVPGQQTIEADICIVGAGPAGITLARALSGADRRICLLESGGFEYDADTQALCAGEVAGDSDQCPYWTRRRQFGGTSNAWNIDLGHGRRGVRWVPLDAVDFERRDAVPYSGWPFPRTCLDLYYMRAQEVCQIGPFAYDGADWSVPQAPPLYFPGDRLRSNVFQIGPARVFAEHYRAELVRSRNIDVYLNANVLELEADKHGRTVRRANVACLSGNRFSVVARTFVLATGAIENARLLLLSDGVQTGGLGNQHDLVGRYFMDHSLDYGGRLTPSHRRLFGEEGIFYDRHRVNGQHVMGKITPSPAALRHEPLLNAAVHLLPRHRTHGVPALSDLRVLAQGSFLRESGAQTRARLGSLGGGMDLLIEKGLRKALRRPNYFPILARGGWSECVSDPEREFGSFELVTQIEQLPDPDNRVTLGEARDRLGQRLARVEWRWSERELQALEHTRQMIRAEMQGAGLGSVEMKQGRASHTGCHHHLGTTRMHDDPRQGVVDVNCRVHGMANLFIAGSSVFPTGGYANPTLTIVALALRLADHLKSARTTQPARVQIPTASDLSLIA